MKPNPYKAKQDKVFEKIIDLINEIPLQDLKDATSKINDANSKTLINDVYDSIKYKFNSNSADTIADINDDLVFFNFSITFDPILNS